MRSFIAASILTLGAAVVPLASATAGPVTHTIVTGDTLWSIAHRYRVSVAQLEARNHLTDSSILRLGDTIVVSDARPAKAGRSRLASAGAFRPRPSYPANNLTTVARNALWVATHTGQAPPPPGAEPYGLVQRILAFDAAVTHTALRYLGVPYAWGGTSFSGVDCSGFVQAVFEHNGITLPRTADSQFEVGRAVRSGRLQPGDLVFFETYTDGVSHVGIYIGGGRFIHASSSEGVRIDDLSDDYYATRYVGARRLIH